MFSFAAGLRRTRVLAVVASLLFIAILGVVAVLLARDRRGSLDAVITAQGNLTLGLERDILRNIDIYDLSLRAVASGARVLDNSIDDAARRTVLFDGAPAARFFRPLLIADGMGTPLGYSSALTPKIANIADRPFFQAHRSRDDLGLLVLLIDRSSIDGRPYLSLSRRVSGRDGRFEGIVTGGLSLDYFGEIFSKFALGPGAAISLVGYDGRLVAGFPSREGMAGRDVSGGGIVDRALLRDFSNFETTSVVDGVTRLATVRRLGTLPYFLAVGIPTETVYAGWRERAWTACVGVFGLTGVSALLLAALSRELERRRLAERRAGAAAEAVRASERRLGTYFDHLADGILAIRRTREGRFVYERVNAAASRMLGICPEDAIGRQPREVWGEVLGQSVEERLRECLGANAPVSYERTFEAAEGRRVLRFLLAPVREGPSDGLGGAGVGGAGVGGAGVESDGTGSAASAPVTLLLASLRDVTATVVVETHLRQAQRMEAVGQLTAGVAHDFNNMLQAQLGALELLLSELGDRPRARRHAKLALAANEHGSSLTHSLLSFSRQQHLAPLAVPVVVLLDRLRQMLSHTLETRIDLRVVVEDGIAAPFADMAQLESALLNLALNARDAMPEGGMLMIEARCGRAGDSAPEGMVAADHVLLAVSDNGAGMLPHVAARACEPFFTTKGVGKGSGLGLSMVQGFMQQSGGAMRIVSAPGQGSRVELWLPRAVGAAAAGEGAREAAARVGGGRRILLVDDAPEVLAVTAELLADEGFEVVQAADGIEALTLLKTERAFDVLVTDFMMPGIDGGELIRRAAQMFPTLPALVITGYAESEVLGKLPGHVEVLRKPLRGDVLSRHVADVLGRAREQRKSAVSVDAA